jgi:hypothetical protein
MRLKVALALQKWLACEVPVSAMFRQCKQVPIGKAKGRACIGRKSRGAGVSRGAGGETPPSSVKMPKLRVRERTLTAQRIEIPTLEHGDLFRHHDGLSTTTARRKNCGAPSALAGWAGETQRGMCPEGIRTGGRSRAPAAWRVRRPPSRDRCRQPPVPAFRRVQPPPSRGE